MRFHHLKTQAIGLGLVQSPVHSNIPKLLGLAWFQDNTVNTDNTAFHHSVNRQQSVRAHVTLFYYHQAKHQIPVKKSLKKLQDNLDNLLYIFVTNIVHYHFRMIKDILSR